ncbi:hypothetical protein [Chachezhania sediminis]|uniref:hypothetical protein n=1 Tax=Chachezhania sediminis TaxID=2599291 RepID=UPI00131C1FE7|nr:hypothetical protein [Chachezhania sediminis]
MLLPFALAACLNYADYSLAAYTNATEAKAQSLALIEKATGSYSANRDAADAVLLKLDQGYEFSAGVRDNEEATYMWDRLRSRSGYMVGGFVEFWRRERPGGMAKDSAFLREYRDNIADAFDRLICLEANKGKPAKCPVPQPN